MADESTDTSRRCRLWCGPGSVCHDTIMACLILSLFVWPILGNHPSHSNQQHATTTSVEAVAFTHECAKSPFDGADENDDCMQRV